MIGTTVAVNINQPAQSQQLTITPQKQFQL